MVMVLGVIIIIIVVVVGERGGAVVLGTALQPGRSRVRFPMVSLRFFIDNNSGRTMALGLTQPLTEITARNIFWAIKAAGAYS
jgi:hypothetical protein